MKVCSSAIFAVFFLGIFLLTTSDHAKAETNEEKLKVAYMYKFTKFIKWPSENFKNNTIPFNICTLGVPSFSSLLPKLTRSKYGAHPITIFINPNETEIPKCHMLYIEDISSINLNKIQVLARQNAILTISSQAENLPQTAMVNFYLSKGRLRFAIKLNDLTAAKLEISSRILKIARVIKEGKNE